MEDAPEYTTRTSSVVYFMSGRKGGQIGDKEEVKEKLDVGWLFTMSESWAGLACPSGENMLIAFDLGVPLVIFTKVSFPMLCDQNLPSLPSSTGLTIKLNARRLARP